MDSSGWPESIPELGPKEGGPFGPCVCCPEGAHPTVCGTFVSYGGFPLCRACALTLSRPGDPEHQAFVTDALRRARAARGL